MSKIGEIEQSFFNINGDEQTINKVNELVRQVNKLTEAMQATSTAFEQATELLKVYSDILEKLQKEMQRRSNNA